MFRPNDAFYEKLEENTFVAFIMKHPVIISLLNICCCFICVVMVNLWTVCVFLWLWLLISRTQAKHNTNSEKMVQTMQC